MKRFLLIAPLALTLSVSPSQAAQTIVGMWKLVGQDCTPAAGAMIVRPMAVGWDELVCSFDSVTRKGSTVTWQGACTEPSGDVSAVRAKATERAGKLDVRLNGQRDPNGLYVRCRAGEY